MRTHTIILHESLIRLAKGMIKAWETWLEASKQAAKTRQPDSNETQP